MRAGLRTVCGRNGGLEVVGGRVEVVGGDEGGEGDGEEEEVGEGVRFERSGVEAGLFCFALL